MQPINLFGRLQETHRGTKYTPTLVYQNVLLLVAPYMTQETAVIQTMSQNSVVGLLFKRLELILLL